MILSPCRYKLCLVVLFCTIAMLDVLQAAPCGQKRSFCEYRNCQKFPLFTGFCQAHGLDKRCRVENCSKLARQGGQCIAHGGGKPCQAEGCMSLAQSGKFCAGHGGGKRCGRDRCGKFALRGGFCRAHGGGKRCQVEQCASLAKSGGLCFDHSGLSSCEVAGCIKVARSHKRCFLHGGAERCRVARCRKISQADGFCLLHGAPEHRVTEISHPTAGDHSLEFAFDVVPDLGIRLLCTSTELEADLDHLLELGNAAGLGALDLGETLDAHVTTRLDLDGGRSSGFEGNTGGTAEMLAPAPEIGNDLVTYEFEVACESVVELDELLHLGDLMCEEMKRNSGARAPESI
ncbi:MAG: hypothetical protein OXT67_13630 [Zetaproteobacteria bacterium]|nr:hypothetical protein [Zetaproteobacteria bacterium]